MDIGAIDRSATSGRGWLHRVSPQAKLAAFALILAAVVISWNALLILAVALLLMAVIASAGIDAGVAAVLAAYPAVFAVLFALASAPDAITGFTIVLKAVTAALAAVTVVLSTPYPQIFAPVQRIVPGIVGDALLMTYRATFLLLGKFENLLRAMRLRAGVRGTQPVRSARATTRSLGGLLLYSFDLAQRDYDIMRLRGYSGRLRAHLPRSPRPAVDAVLLAGCAAIAVSAVAWRLGSAVLNPYSWLLPLAALLPLALALTLRWRTR